ncbi:hypothetical protein SLE2022_299830 [Rubroshorea leprosula]
MFSLRRLSPNHLKAGKCPVHHQCVGLESVFSAVASCLLIDSEHMVEQLNLFFGNATKMKMLRITVTN